MIYDNYKRIRKKNQDWQEKDCWPVDKITTQREKYFRSCSVYEVKILDTLIFLSHKYRNNIFIRQKYLGSLVGISREWCNKILLRLERSGLILSNYNHMHSCHYKLSSWFSNPYVASALSHIFKSLRVPLLFALFPNAASEPVFVQPFTRTKDSNSYSYFRYRIPSCHREIMDGYSHSTKKIAALIFKKGERMSPENPISLAIREIKSLSLTKWGQIRLSCYPDEAIVYADKVFTYSHKLKDPFAFFVYQCQEYCKSNGLIPDWQHYGRLAFKYNMPQNAPLLLGEEKLHTVTQADKKKYYSQKQEVESKTPDRQAFYDPNRNFKTGCTLDHEKEIAKFNEQLATIETSQFAKFTGTEYAKNYVMRFIDNHITCLNSNHVQF